MKRRELINWVGLGWLASSLPVAIAACISPTSASTTSPSANWQKVATSAALDKTGQLFVEKSPVGPVLVIGTSKSKKLIAVNPTCTHRGCTVEWNAKTNNFACPCHHAEFGSDGKPQKPPAKTPLKTYAAKIERGSVLVKTI